MTGVQLGGPLGLDYAQAFTDAYTIHRDGPSAVANDYGFVQIITSNQVAVPPPPESNVATGPAEIVGLESGFTPEGLMAVKLTLAEPVPEGGGGSFLKTYQAFLRGPDGEFYSLSYGYRGGELVAFGFCLIGDCREDGMLPGFVATLSDDRTKILFVFDPIEGPLTVAADVLTVETDATDSPSTSSLFQNGEQLPFGVGEIDC